MSLKLSHSKGPNPIL